MVTLYSVWCVNRGKWVGMSPNHVLELQSTPFVNMTSTDMLIAARRRNSLAEEFVNDTFIVLEVR